MSHLRIFGSEYYNQSQQITEVNYNWDVERSKAIVGRNITFNGASILNRMNIIEILDSEAAKVPNGVVRNNETIDTSVDEQEYMKMLRTH